MKEKLMSLFSQSSTWRGIINFFGGVGGIASYFLDPHLALVVPAITLSVSGIIGAVTSDYKNTPSKADDILNAIATGIDTSKK